MTCIAAVEDAGVVWMGGDSALSDESFISTYAETKVWVNGEFVFGYCDGPRYGALLRYSFVPPKIKGNIDKYLTNEFVPKLKDIFAKDTELQSDEDGKYPQIEFLFGVRGKLYVCDNSYSINRPHDGFCATGGGRYIATGVLYANARLKPRERILQALRASEKYTPSVRGPFTVVRTPDHKAEKAEAVPKKAKP